MKTNGVKKFLRCMKSNGVVEDDEKCKCKGGNIGEDDVVEHVDIFLSSHNSFNGSNAKRNHKKLPHFLKGMFRASSLKSKFGSFKYMSKSSSQTSRNTNSPHPNPQLQRNSSDSSSIFTSSSMASSSLASSCSYPHVSLRTRPPPEPKKTCSNDHTQTTFEQVHNNINGTICKYALMEKANGCYFGSNYGICFLILGLLILLTWGKLFAMFCTSMCLLFARPRQLKVIQNNSQLLLDDNMLNIIELSEKKVVIAGF